MNVGQSGWSVSRCGYVSVVAGCALLLVTLAATDARAQLNTQHVKGSAGLKAGSQAPPGGYIILPVFYVYHSDTVEGINGKLPVTADLTAMFFAAGFSQVTTKKVFGGTYGYSVLFPAGANNRIQGTEIDQNPGAGLTDSVFEPVMLGWHGKRADAIASFTMYIPTGRYTDGASNNTGLGMWGYEPAFGTTVYLDEKKQYHAATMLSFDFQSKKEDSETKVGNQLNLEGGVGGDFLKGGLTVGLNYYAAFKVSDDVIQGVPGQLVRGRNKTFGLGPEATLAIVAGHAVRGFVTTRFFWEPYARVTTKGNAFLVQAVLLTKPIKLP
jgi:hypothetical protein